MMIAVTDKKGEPLIEKIDVRESFVRYVTGIFCSSLCSRCSAFLFIIFLEKKKTEERKKERKVLFSFESFLKCFLLIDFEKSKSFSFRWRINVGLWLFVKQWRKINQTFGKSTRTFFIELFSFVRWSKKRKKVSCERQKSRKEKNRETPAEKKTKWRRVLEEKRENDSQDILMQRIGFWCRWQSIKSLALGFVCVEQS